MRRLPIIAIFALWVLRSSFCKKYDTNPLFGAAVGLMSWFLLMPYITVAGSVEVGGAAQSVYLLPAFP